MKRVTMVAMRVLRYRTRRLRPGDVFDLAPAEARLYAAVGLAAEAPKQRLQTRHAAPARAAPPSPPPPAPSAPSAAAVEAPPPVADEIEALRAEYEAKTGRKPDRRWGAERLRAGIKAADAFPDAQPAPSEPETE